MQDTTKRALISLLAVAPLVVAAVIGFPRNTLAQSPKASFTVNCLERATNPKAGNSGTAEKVIVRAYRPDGSFVIAPIVPKHGIRKVVLMKEQKEIDISDTLGQVTTYDHSSEPPLPAMSSTSTRPRDRCAPSAGPRSKPWIFVGETKLNDLQVFRYRAPTRSNGDGSSEEKETWYSPVLDCYPVKTEARIVDQHGVVLGTFESVVTSHRIGEPDASLFSVDPAFREVSPSELEKGAMMAELKERLGPEEAAKFKAPAAFRARWDSIDKKYKTLREAATRPAR